MKTRIVSILVVALFVISSATMAQNQKGTKVKPDRKEMMMKHRMRPGGERTNFLTKEQKGAIKILRLKTAKEVKPLKNELNELMARQQTLTTSDNANLDAIYANIDKISEVKTGIAKIMAKQQLEFRSTLTEEQQLKLDSRKNIIKQGHRDTTKNRKGKPGQRSFSKGA